MSFATNSVTQFVMLFIADENTVCSAIRVCLCFNDILRLKVCCSFSRVVYALVVDFQFSLYLVLTLFLSFLQTTPVVGYLLCLKSNFLKFDQNYERNIDIRKLNQYPDPS